MEEYLKYNPETGVITWTVSPSRNIMAGKEAGSVTAHGYRKICFRRKFYLAHRVAFTLMGIDIKRKEVDHINGNPLDNRWCNLRIVSRKENLANLKRHRAGRLIGATYRADSNKWQSQIRRKGSTIYLGLFDTELEAHKAYLKALEELK